MMPSNISKSDWSKVKGEIQKTWSSLNASDLEQTHGNVTEICHLVQKKYGLRPEDAERRLDEVIKRCGTSAGKASVTEPGRSERSSNSSKPTPSQSQRSDPSRRS